MKPDWRDHSRILVTGAAGFIGSHFVDHLLTRTGAEIVVLDRLSGAGDLGRLACLECWEWEKGRVRILWHDLKAPLGPQLLDRIGQVDAVVHFAASSHVDNSIADPALFVLDNVLGTTHLLDAARSILRPGGTFLNFSTDECFGPVAAGERARTEEDQWRPSNPYAASKAGATAMGWAFARTYGVPVVTTYSMNVFGERQHTEKWVPKAIRGIIRGDELRIHTGAGGAIGSRTWLHAGSVAHAVAHILDVAASGESYNIVNQDEYDNLEIAQLIASILGKPLRYRLESGDVSRPGYDARYAIDGSKLLASGWKPPRPFAEALEATVRWTAEHPTWVGL